MRSIVAAIGRKHKPHRGQNAATANNNWRNSADRLFNMGQEESSPINESVPPRSLAGRTVEALAEYIKSGRAEKIVVMTGAGISKSNRWFGPTQDRSVKLAAILNFSVQCRRLGTSKTYVFIGNKPANSTTSHSRYQCWHPGFPIVCMTWRKPSI